MAQTPKRGLGAGLGSLIPQTFDTTLLLDENERIQKLPVTAIKPDPGQPRRIFDETALEELADSLKTHGVLQPIVVAPHESGTFQIIAGERRWRAATIAKLQTIPAIVRTLKEQQRLEVAIIENVQRVDLSPLEQAVSIERLYQQFGMSYDTISQQLGKAKSTVNNIVRLLQLPEDAREALNTKVISEGHARAILALKQDPAAQKKLLDTIVRQGWSVREAERFVVAYKEGHQSKAATKRVSTETPETKALSARLDAQVHIKRTAKGGRLEINFSSDKDLERIIAQLQKPAL